MTSSDSLNSDQIRQQATARAKSDCCSLLRSLMARPGMLITLVVLCLSIVSLADRGGGEVGGGGGIDMRPRAGYMMADDGLGYQDRNVAPTQNLGRRRQLIARSRCLNGQMNNPEMRGSLEHTARMTIFQLARCYRIALLSLVYIIPENMIPRQCCHLDLFRVLRICRRKPSKKPKSSTTTKSPHDGSSTTSTTTSPSSTKAASDMSTTSTTTIEPEVSKKVVTNKPMSTTTSRPSEGPKQSPTTTTTMSPSSAAPSKASRKRDT